MPYYYSSLSFPDGENFSQDYTLNGKTAKNINNLSHVNIFIGSNNSGKSRFMREISKLSSTQYQRTDMDLERLKSEYVIFKDSINNSWTGFANSHVQSQIEGYGIINPPHINFSDYIPESFSKSYFEGDRKVDDLKKLLVALRDSHITAGRFRNNPDNATGFLKAELLSKKSSMFIKLLDDYIFEPIAFKKYYLPTLRSLNDFDSYQSDPKSDIFAERVRNVYKFDAGDVDIFTGQILYERIRSMLLGDLDERKKIRDYEKFLSEKLFDGEEVVIIPKENHDVVNVKIGENERPIYELGDGIQSIIMLTFPLFECENGVFYIEEPELNLHPGLQRKFLEAIQSKVQHQFFLTTHSNHLLDLTLDYNNVSIFSFRKIGNRVEDKHEINTVTYGDKNVLDLLGVNNTSVFLANKTVWVEGITDRLYISKYLELYIKALNLTPLRKDLDYIFVEYGGDNITHWSFLDSNDETIDVERLCGNLLLILDHDKGTKEKRKKELKLKLKDRYYELKCNEIENSLSLKTLERVISSYEGEFTMPNNLDDSKRITEPLGGFIEQEIFSANSIEVKRKGGYKDDSGTIKSKLSFCKKAIENLTYEEMSDEAIKIVEKIYNFVST